MKKFLFALVAVMLLFALSAAVCADGKAGFGKDRGGMMMGAGMMMNPKMLLSMAAELNLTADQMDKLKTMAADMPAIGSKKDGIKKDMEDFKAEMQKDAPDQDKINAMIDKMADSHKAAMKERIKNALAVRAVLTKDQREILKKKMEDRKEKTGKWMGKDKKDGDNTDK
jgi:Spy/CpxP family protein refolding chaperone